MIKNINNQNFLNTPFIAIKEWELFNIANDNVVLLEPPGGPEIDIALEYVDFLNDGTPFLNTSCNIALEQQDNDEVSFDEGISGSGFFDPSVDEKNLNGTFKRLVYSQTKLSFYNTYNNPFKILGTEFIDFPSSKTNRNLSNNIRVFTIPQQIFGDKIVPGSVSLYDNSFDDNVNITDDGYQNLTAGNNLFSKIQELRSLGNIIMNGSASFTCATLDSFFFWNTTPDNWNVNNNDWNASL